MHFPPHRSWLFALTLALLAWAACATGEGPRVSVPQDVEEDPGTTSDADAEDGVEDPSDEDGVGDDAEDDTHDTEDPTPDTDVADDPPEETRDAVDGDTEDAVDDRQFCDDTWVGICRPRRPTCSRDRTKIIRCGLCGEELTGSVVQTCGPRELCELDGQGDARCRPCAPGDTCPDDQVQCEAGTRGCLAWNEPFECAPNGVKRSLGNCAGGAFCVAGACVGSGGRTGDACVSHGQCLGNQCVCGEEYRAANPTEFLCFRDVASGFCTRAPCFEQPCHPDREVCVDFAEMTRFDSDNFCVERDTCSRPGASCNGGRWRCTELPSRSNPGERLVWHLGCWPGGLRYHGESCEPLTGDCIGGRCVRGGNDVTYCTSDCGAEQTCPTNSECVENPAGSNRFQCLVRSDASPCVERLASEIGIVPTTRRLFGGGSASVCAPTRP